MVGVLPRREATRLDRRLDVLLERRLGVEALEFLERDRGEHRSLPGAEILCRDVAAGDLAQVGVDVRRRHVPALAVLVDVLEQLLAGEVLAGAHDLGDAPVLDLEAPDLAALALELEAQLRAVHRDVLVLQRGEAVALVLLWRNRRCRPGSASSREGRRRSPAPFRAAGRAAPCARRSSRGSPAGPSRTRACARISCSRGSPGNRGGSGTACGPWRRARSPGCGRSLSRRSTRRCRPAGRRAS